MEEIVLGPDVVHPEILVLLNPKSRSEAQQSKIYTLFRTFFSKKSTIFLENLQIF